MEQTQANVSETGSAIATFAADTRYTFTCQYLESSAIFIRRARAIEATSSEQTDDTTRCEYLGLLCAVIMQCAAALETEAHEICVYGPGANFGWKSNDTNPMIQQFLSPLADMIDDQSTLSRFEIILHLLGKPPLDRGTEPYQSAALVVRLRNELVHYKSHWGVEIESKKLYSSLQSLGHKPPPFFSHPSINFFPLRCLSADCGAWALSSVVAFMESFYTAVGTPNRFKDYQSRFVP
jgi:hypothetical protein